MDSQAAKRLTADPVASVAEWRAAGAGRADPLRLHFLEALARRAALHDGALRQRLDERLATLMAACDARGPGCDDGQRDVLPGADGSSGADRDPGPLARLLEEFAPRTTPTAAPRELESALAYFRGTWSKLAAERHLTQSSDTVPVNAGPLNSNHLLHRALLLMRELSPGYLEHFMAHADGLLWLDQLAVGAPQGAESSTASPAKKTARAKARKPRAGG